jgi:hypothetical protein
MTKFLRILALVVGVAFVLLLIVGFDNVFALLRSRVALGLALLPLFLLFLWCLYKAFTPERRLEDRTYRDKKSV